MIVADEPTGSLDSQSQEMVLEVFKNLAQTGKTVLIVTHNPEVAEYADVIIKMKDGEVVEEVKNKGLSLKNKFKLSLNNFLERKWRNLLIALATSIGFVGVLISFGLGNALISMIDENTNGGQIPSQVQIALNTKNVGRGFLNQDDKNYITDTVGKEAIKYLESPFGMTMSNITIDGQELDLSQTMPSYAQVVSLYEDTSISVSSNEEDKVVAGSLYTDANEQGFDNSNQFT